MATVAPDCCQWHIHSR